MLTTPHIELIDPREKIDPSLGGTGYQPPRQPASATALFMDADTRSREPLNRTVWKVARSSVAWGRGRWPKNRRLRVEDRTVICTVIGGNSDWWFVAVDAYAAASRLTVR